MSGKKNWRLSRTLKRNVEVRPIEQEDVQYAWAAYCKGKLKDMGPPFDQEGMTPQEFKDHFEALILSEFKAAWTIRANTRNGFIPVGFVFGNWAHQSAPLTIIGIVWLGWASKRNILEGTVAFFNKLRKEMKWMGFATDEHKPLYEVCCAHSIMRQVGTSYPGGGRVAVYEGRYVIPH